VVFRIAKSKNTRAIQAATDHPIPGNAAVSRNPLKTDKPIVVLLMPMKVPIDKSLVCREGGCRLLIFFLLSGNLSFLLTKSTLFMDRCRQKF
jgi:hypothetical protein